MPSKQPVIPLGSSPVFATPLGRWPLLFLLAVAGLNLEAATYVNRVYESGTQNYAVVPATITGPTIWTAANSPYVLEGWDYNLLIQTNASLTVEPGVVIAAPSSRQVGAKPCE